MKIIKIATTMKTMTEFEGHLMNLFDIYERDEWQSILDSLHEKLGMTISLLDSQSAQLLKSGTLNPLCQKLREKPENRTFICAQSARGMTAELMEKKEAVCDFCEAGMTRFAVPVIRGGELLGQVTGCGIITDRDEMDIHLLAKQMDISRENAEAVVNMVEVAEQEKVNAAVRMLAQRLSPPAPWGLSLN